MTTKRKQKPVQPQIYDEMTVARAARHVKGISRETAAEVVDRYVKFILIGAQGGKISKRFTWGQFLDGLQKWRDNNPYQSRRISV